ncbi:hypothetical protein [Oceanobacter sp. 3_MG-2023]|uniref:hypothetical protein n=1 Tax=Oceanobacter sp. 3_MG-2023 TaxID=3062622 RepID=UPI00273432FB|nr:hypothetical protein [Oceanobacter sp. 3_MG-2023]MDP2504875.1 hypothetical protein [Oceanobacter sp. 3_MG-2023]
MNHESVEQLMGVVSPWIIHDIRINQNHRRVEVCIGQARSGWFGSRRAIQHFGHHKTWRHTNLGVLKCTIRIDYPEGDELPNAPWSGDARAPFSNALGQQVIAMLTEGMSLGTIARLLELDADMLWQFKHGLDTGKLGSNLNQTTSPDISPDMMSVLTRDQQKSALPAADIAIWRELLTGERDLDMRNLGLRLLLMRLRQQYAMAHDEEVRMLKIQQLRRYFEKNPATAGREIEQIREAVQ